MITGYNTDVRHADLVIHVQTEDKGQSNPLIESLIYVGGQVLAARRSGYSQLLQEGKGEQDVIRLMERQHRTMIAAIKSGRFDGKLIALLGDRAPKALTTGAAAAEAAGSAAPAETEEDDSGDGTVTTESKPANDRDTSDTDAPPTGEVAKETVEAEPPGPGEPTLDQVILEYLTNEASQEQLLMTVHEGVKIALGLPANLVLRTTSSKTGQAVVGAEVTVRMISTVDEPQALARGRTDDDGHLELDLSVPALERGTAALIITASSPIGRAEIKQLL